jgi:hypothetical protein
LREWRIENREGHGALKKFGALLLEFRICTLNFKKYGDLKNLVFGRKNNSPFSVLNPPF